MAPSAVETEIPVIPTKQIHREPLKSLGSLDGFESIDVTPVIGTEYPTANLVEWINSPNADDLIRDLAIKSKGAVPHNCPSKSNIGQSPSVVSCSSGHKTTLPAISKKPSYKGLESWPENQRHRLCISIRFSTPNASWVAVIPRSPRFRVSNLKRYTRRRNWMP